MMSPAHLSAQTQSFLLDYFDKHSWLRIATDLDASSPLSGLMTGAQQGSNNAQSKNLRFDAHVPAELSHATIVKVAWLPGSRVYIQCESSKLAIHSLRLNRQNENVLSRNSENTTADLSWWSKTTLPADSWLSQWGNNKAGRFDRQFNKCCTVSAEGGSATLEMRCREKCLG